MRKKKIKNIRKVKQQQRTFLLLLFVHGKVYVLFENIVWEKAVYILTFVV